MQIGIHRMPKNVKKPLFNVSLELRWEAVRPRMDASLPRHELFPTAFRTPKNKLAGTGGNSVYFCRNEGWLIVGFSLFL